MKKPPPFWANYPEYVFFRAEGFYMVQLRDDEDAVANALNNPGTLRVENVAGKVVWPVQAAS